MVLTLYLFGHEVLTLSTEVRDDERQAEYAIGFAAAELAEPFFPPER